MKIVQAEQRSEEWFAARRGIPSASNFAKIITTKGEPSKQAEKYMFRLAGEKVSGITEETYQSAAMIRGCEMEKEAREFYELIKGATVEEVGFCLTDDGKVGCSPDGLVGEDGLIEIKDPIASTQVAYLLKGVLPLEYFQQVQGQLYVTGRKWLDFISYYPGLKPLMVRVLPDVKFQVNLDAELKKFCINLDEVVRKIQ